MLLYKYKFYIFSIWEVEIGMDAAVDVISVCSSEDSSHIILAVVMRRKFL